jgi:hypothetical protein
MANTEAWSSVPPTVPPAGESDVEELFRARYLEMVRLAGLLGADDPEDIAQEAFIRLMNKRGGDSPATRNRDTPIKVNAANPGYTKTDLNRNTGFRSVAEGAEASVYLATLPADSPSGVLWGHLWTADAPHDAYGTLPW